MMCEVKDPSEEFTPNPVTPLKPGIRLNPLIKLFPKGPTEEKAHRQP